MATKSMWLYRLIRAGVKLCYPKMQVEGIKNLPDAPALKTMYIGKPTVFDPEAPMEQERQRICDYLMDEITRTAQELPLHTVVPYRNIPKKDYPKNRREAAL